MVDEIIVALGTGLITAFLSYIFTVRVMLRQSRRQEKLRALENGLTIINNINEFYMTLRNIHGVDYLAIYNKHNTDKIGFLLVGKLYLDSYSYNKMKNAMNDALEIVRILCNAHIDAESGDKQVLDELLKSTDARCITFLVEQLVQDLEDKIDRVK